LSAADIEPGTSDVAGTMLIVGVCPPVDWIGAVALTEATPLATMDPPGATASEMVVEGLETSRVVVIA